MKTSKFSFSRITCIACCWLAVALPASAQNEATGGQSSTSAARVALPASAQDEASVAPESISATHSAIDNDAASTQLIENYLTVTGGRKAHRALRNVVAEGRIKESTLERNFRLIETADGKRHLTYHWIHLGRKHRVVYAHDGLQTWTQVLEPEREEPTPYTGTRGRHFARQHWLLQPFTLPMRADYTFLYHGVAKVRGRSAHMIKGQGPQKADSWFYFDKEKSLLTRWGGLGRIGGTNVAMDYQATRFKSFSGILFPTRIDLLAEDAAFGELEFEQIQTNQKLQDISFRMPKSSIPTLRQRSIKND